MIEHFLPDPIERCQDALRRSWYAAPEGECWYLSRSAIERFFQEDAAGNDLPDEWRKLLVVANTPTESVVDLPDWQGFTTADWAELSEWSRQLGDKLDLAPLPMVAEIEAEKPPAPRATKNNFAFIAISVLVPLIGMYAYMSRRLSTETAARQVAERSMASTQGALAAKDAELLGEKKGRIAMLAQVDQLTRENARLIRDKSKLPVVPAEVPGISLAPLTQARNAGRSSGWDVRTPAYTALRDAPSSFTWKPGKKMPANLRIFDAESQASVWSHPVDLADGKFANAPKLKPGHYYLWSIVTDSEDEGFTGVPFYVLSHVEKTRLLSALNKSKSDSERGALLVKFGLYDELGSFGTQLKRRFAIE